ncbi:MAG: hypothetical protein K0R73_384 [Candidatus Midichloriaceae bacterium]|jgi:hypothetical protein|nr:hypothetical protein [Candidatus Midichloriaceae bacterium]
MILRAALFFIIICLNGSAMANTEKEVISFIKDIESLMNLRDKEELSRFYKFYSEKNARFVKQSSLVNTDDPDMVVGQENLDMNVDEYITYLNSVIMYPSKYAYFAKITSIQINPQNKSAVVSVEAKDSSISYREGENENPGAVYILSTSNCNYSLNYKSAHYYISGMNCVETINRQ